MRPTQLKAEIKSRVKAEDTNRAIHIVGPPGVGKTQIVEQVAKELGIGFKVIHAPLMQPEDYGFPIVNKETNTVTFVVSTDKFPVEGSNCPETGILLIDELAQCDHATQKILANLIQAREIHGKKLKKGWKLVSTGNRAADRSGAARPLCHLRDRYTEVLAEVSLDDWCNWAITNEVKVEVISFIRFRPELLSAFNPQADDKTPTPRAWVEGISASLGVVSSENEYEMFKGDVGEGAAAEFLGYLKIYRKLPNPDAIMLNPKGTPVPEIGKDKDASAICYALCGALAHRTTDANFGRIMQYIERMKQEFVVLYVRDAIKHNPNLAACKDFIKWATSTGADILT